MIRFFAAVLLALCALSSSAQELVRFMQNDKWGFKDEMGNIVIQPIYDILYSFSEGLAKAKLNDKYGFIDEKGEVAIQFVFDYVKSFSEGLAPVEQNGEYGFIDKMGKFVIKLKFDDAKSFSDGLAAVKQGDKWGYIDKSGNFVIQPIFRGGIYGFGCNSFSEGLCGAAYSKKKYGFIDKSGNFVIQPKYEEVGEFREGLAKIKYKGKWGFVDKSGNEVVPCIYEDVRDFRESLAAFKVKDKWGYIDKSGNTVIKPMYEGYYKNVIIGDFENGLALVQYKGKEGFIDTLGRFYETEEEARKILDKESNPFNKTYSEYMAAVSKEGGLTEAEFAAKVEDEVRAWQEKGEFETSAEWQVRVNDQTRAAKIAELAEKVRKENESRLREAAAEYCAHRAEKFAEQGIELKPYDADNQTYLISTEKYGDILLPVPLAEAPSFKQNWETIKKSVVATFVPNGDDVALQSVSFGKYVYDSNTQANYAQVDIDYNFRPIDVSSLNLQLGDLGSEAPAQRQTAVVTPRHVEPERKSLGAGGGVSDVDRDIPSTAGKASRTFALVIANSNYRHASKVANAENDGRVFTNYLKQTLGLPEENITAIHDATFGDIAAGVGHLQDIARAYSREPFHVMVYYVGHGLPDDENRESYILPVDASPRNTRVCYPLNDLYGELAALGAESVTVIIDACFSGANHGGDGMLLAQAMGVAIAPKAAAPKGNMVVLTAAQGDETAFPYAEQNHGLFTYWLLKKLQQTSGKVTLGELVDYVTDNVSKTSVLKNRKPQTPSVAISPALQSSWRNLPLIR